MPAEHPLDAPEIAESDATRPRRPSRRRQTGRENSAEAAESLAVEERPRPGRRRRPANTAVADSDETSSDQANEAAPRRRSRRRSNDDAESNNHRDEANHRDEDFGQGLDVDPAPAARSRRDETAGGDSDDRFEFTENGANSDRRNRAPSNSDSDSGDGNRRRRRRRRRGSQNEGGRSRGDSSQQNSGGRNRGNRGNRGRRNDRDRSRTSSNTVSAEVTGVIEGILELHPKGYGFLRDPKNNYSARDTDPFVSSTMIEKHRLREGVSVRGDVGPGAKGQGPRLKSLETVDGRSLEEYQDIKNFEELTPINPFEQIVLEQGPEPVTMRVMDLLTPIGKGQRALIVSPPRSGKTILLQEIAESVSVNHPEVHLIVLLVDERPEEVTEMRRCVKGEVVASSLDREVENHIRISQLVFERAKRMAESGQEVFILLDSITRLARAFNKWVNNSGRTGTGGLDIRALDIPKKMFGTARRFEEGGSLTVAGTALVETGGRMDDAIFQEFKGTGNMELVLSRELADRRIWPAIDIAQSGTRREEKLLSPKVLEGATLLRRSLISLTPVQAMEDLTRTLRKFPNNEDFLDRVQQVL